MNQDLALRILGEIMQWDMDRARKEFAWLRLMSRLKYDDYQGFLVGVRFIESLADWLQQFAPEEREIAYSFVRRNWSFRLMRLSSIDVGFRLECHAIAYNSKGS